MSENLFKINRKSKEIIELINKYHNYSSEVYSVTDRPHECSRTSMPMISTPNRTVDEAIHRWLGDLLSSSKNIDILADNSLGVLGKGDDDLRIREMTEEERQSVDKYATIHGVIIFRKKKLHVSLLLFLFLFFHPILIFIIIVKRCLLSSLYPPFF
jgi:hypothetical protein